MINSTLRTQALMKLAATGGQLDTLVSILASHGITSDDAVKSLIDTVSTIAKEQGRAVTLSDIGSVLSRKMQNGLAETATTAGSTLKPQADGLMKGVLNTIGKHKKPLALGIAGLGVFGGSYGLIRREQRNNTLTGRLRRIFS